MSDKDILCMIKAKAFRYDNKQRPYYSVSADTRRNGRMLVPKAKLLKIARENNLNLEDHIIPY